MAATLDSVFAGTNITLSNGDLTAQYSVASAANGHAVFANTPALVTGKYYWEVVVDEVSATSFPYAAVGVSPGLDGDLNGHAPGLESHTYNGSGTKSHNVASGVAYGTAWTNGDVVGIALDMDIGAIWFSLNGTWQDSATISEIQAGTTTNAAFTGLDDRAQYPVTSVGNGGSAQAQITHRFDSASFSHTVPTGFTAGLEAFAAAYDQWDGRLNNRSAQGAIVALQDVHFDVSSSNNDASMFGRYGFTGGKYYFEVEILLDSSGTERVGVGNTFSSIGTLGSQTTSYGYMSNGQKINSSSGQSYGATYTAGDVIGVAVDFDAGVIWFSKNDVWQDSATLTEVQDGTTTNAAYTFTASGTYHIVVSGVNASSGDDSSFRMHSDPANFSGTQPTGFDAWAPPFSVNGAFVVTPEMAGTGSVSPIHADGGFAITPAMSGAGGSTTNRGDGSFPVPVSVAGTGSVSPIHADGGFAVTPAVTGTLRGRITADGAFSVTPAMAGTTVLAVNGSIDAALGILGSSIDGLVTTDAAINAQLDGPESAIAGAVGVDGSIGADLGELESAVAGQVEYTGSISGALGVLGASITGFVPVSGAIDADLGVVGAYIVGDVGLADTVHVAVMNLKTLAITEYESYPFNSLIEWNGQHYGADENGIYLLTGDSDAGTDIDARLRTGITDHDSDVTKRVSDVYLSGKSSKPVLFSLLLDEGAEKYDYEVPLDATASYNAYKADVGRGARARFLQYEFANTQGADMELDYADIMVEEIERRRKR